MNQTPFVKKKEYNRMKVTTKNTQNRVRKPIPLDELEYSHNTILFDDLPKNAGIFVGPPKASYTHTTQQLKEMGMVGVYYAHGADKRVVHTV